MKKLFIALLILFFVPPCHTFMQMTGNYVAPAGGVTCSGDMSTGDNESFEKGAGEFCTTDWTEADTDGVVSTYYNGGAFCGSYSLQITHDSDNANDNRIYGDIGSADTDIYVRFYLTLPTLASAQYIRPMYIGPDNTASTANVYLQWYNSSGTYQFKLRGTDNPAEYFNLTPGAQYRIEIHTIKNSAECALMVFDSNGEGVVSSSGGEDYTQNCTGANVDIRYIIFRDQNSTGAAVVSYIDDVVVDVDGAGYIGAQTCE